MATPVVMLYWGSGSSPCWSVMIALHEKGIHYNQKLISFDQKEHKGEEIVRLNPRGQVPTLIVGDIVINESLASCLFLEKNYGDQGYKLIPEEPSEMATVLQRMCEVAPFRKKIAEELIWRAKRETNEDYLKMRRQEAVEELQRWETYLEQQGDNCHIASKDFSMADVIFFPPLAVLIRAGLKITPRFPKLTAYYEMVKQRPSVETGWPPHWKTSENQTVLSNLV